jgi:hypothetical protein
MHIATFIYLHSSQLICTHDEKFLHTLHSSSIRSTNLYLFHSSNPIDQKKVLREPYLGVAAVDRWQWRWRRKRPVKTVVVVHQVRGVDDGDWWSRERQRLREFWDEKRNNTGHTIIYRFVNISIGSGLKPLLIVLESRLKWF